MGAMQGRPLQTAVLQLVRPLAAALGDRWMRLLGVAFITGQVCDTLTTHVALASGRFREANPLFAPAMDEHQTLALVLKASIAVAVLMMAVFKLRDPRRRMVLGVLALISLEAPLTNSLRILGVM